jgi:hypothetical protein
MPNPESSPLLINSFSESVALSKRLTTNLKNTFNLEHSRHRSLINFLVNAIASLLAYSYQKKKPSLNLRQLDLLPLFS